MVYYTLHKAYGSTQIRESFDGAFSIYGALKGNQRRCTEQNQCYCRQTTDGKPVHQMMPTCQCNDCRLNG